MASLRRLPDVGRVILGMALLIASLAFVAIPLYALALSEAYGRTVVAIGERAQSVTIETPEDQVSAFVSTATDDPFPGPHLRLDLVVQDLDLAAGILSCQGTITASGDFLASLADDAGPVTDTIEAGTRTGFRLIETYRDATVDVYFLPEFQPGTVDLPVPLAELVAQGRYAFPEAIRLPVSAGRRFYPDDRYVLRGQFGAIFSDVDLIVRSIDPGSPLLLQPDPLLDVRVASSSSLVGRDLIVAQTPAYAPFDAGTWPVHLPDGQRLLAPFTDPTTVTVATDRLTRVYTYLIGTIPILFGVVLAHMRFSARGRERSQSPDFLIGAVVGTLAVLPLREILVPKELTGLTRLDFLLGLGVGTVVGVALLGYGLLVLGDAVRQAGLDFVLRVGLVLVLAGVLLVAVWRTADPTAQPTSIRTPIPEVPGSHPFPSGGPFVPPEDPGASVPP